MSVRVWAQVQASTCESMCVRAYVCLCVRERELKSRGKTNRTHISIIAVPYVQLFFISATFSKGGEKSGFDCNEDLSITRLRSESSSNLSVEAVFFR